MEEFNDRKSDSLESNKAAPDELPPNVASLNEPEQIDAMAEKRGWFRGAPDGAMYPTVVAYMEGSLDLESTVKRLVEPINQEYSTADHGQAIREAEKTAASQREFYSAEEAEELWGAPLPQDEIPPEDNTCNVTTEGLLWDLWYSILHCAKRTPWRDTAAQNRLLDLVCALKACPDPAPPAPMTEALRQNWIWSSGRLWSELTLLGPSARECWNDAPGCGAGFSVPEIHAWANVNAFVAAITKKGLDDFCLYAIWVMRDALEDHHEDASTSYGFVTVAMKLNALVPAAAVWVLVMGKELLEKDDSVPSNPSQGEPSWKGTNAVCKDRWRFWKARFQGLSRREDLMSETKEIAAEAFARMEDIERTAAL